jgi:colanic acid biosynthesis glycosyl transferase WcaI
LQILVVSQYFWPEVFRVNEVVAELRAKGHEVTVLTGRPNYPDGRVFEAFRNRPEDFAQYEGAKVLRVPLRPRGRGSLRLLLNYWSFVFWGCLLGPWMLRGQRFDAIFVFETSPITSVLPALLLRRLRRVPLLLWVLDLWPDTLSAVGMVRSPRGLNAVGALVRFIYRRCDLILAQSRGFFPAIERWSEAPHKTRYFPQWAEASFDGAAVAQAAAAPELASFAGDGFNIMFAGNLGEAQDLPALLDAAEHLQNLGNASGIRWLIVGDGRAAQDLRNDIARRGLQASVFLLGRHPLERMPSFFKGADALLVSLKAEPIFALTVPGKLQSYLAAGKPILAMLDGEGAEVVTAAGAGLVCNAGAGKRLAELALELSQLPQEQRQAMGQRGQQYCREHFNRQKLMRQLETWLQEARHGG